MYNYRRREIRSCSPQHSMSDVRFSRAARATSEYRDLMSQTYGARRARSPSPLRSCRSYDNLAYDATRRSSTFNLYRSYSYMPPSMYNYRPLNEPHPFSRVNTSVDYMSKSYGFYRPSAASWTYPIWRYINRTSYRPAKIDSYRLARSPDSHFTSFLESRWSNRPFTTAVPCLHQHGSYRTQQSHSHITQPELRATYHRSPVTWRHLDSGMNERYWRNLSRSYTSTTFREPPIRRYHTAASRLYWYP